MPLFIAKSVWCDAFFFQIQLWHNAIISFPTQSRVWTYQPFVLPPGWEISLFHIEGTLDWKINQDTSRYFTLNLWGNLRLFLITWLIEQWFMSYFHLTRINVLVLLQFISLLYILHEYLFDIFNHICISHMHRSSIKTGLHSTTFIVLIMNLTHH